MTLAAYALYCVVAGSLWIAETVLAPSWPGLLRICWHDCAVAALFLGFALWSRVKPDWRALLEVGGWCGLLFVGPALTAELVGGHVGSGLATLVLALIPVVTVFVAAQRDEDAMGMVLPAAVGVAGLGLVIPLTWPSSVLGVAGLAGMALLAVGMACAGVRLHGLLRSVPMSWAGAVGAGFAAVVAGLSWAAGSHGAVDWGWKTVGMETAWGLGCDGALVWFVLWLLRTMHPVQFSGRFLLIPGVMLVGGILLERPEVGWTGWLGLGLVVGAGVVLVQPKASGFFSLF